MMNKLNLPLDVSIMHGFVFYCANFVQTLFVTIYWHSISATTEGANFHKYSGKTTLEYA